MKRRQFLQLVGGAVAVNSVDGLVSGDPLTPENSKLSGRVQATRGTSGWRARIGILYPEDGALDDEYFRLAPPGVTIHVTRLPSQSKENEEDALKNAASLFKMIHADCLAYGSNGGSFWNGAGTADKIIESMRKGIDCPVTTATSGVMRAFGRLGVERIAVATPYWKEINDRLRRFLTESKIEIVSFIGPDLQNGEQIYSYPPQEMYRWAVEADRPEAQAVFLPCTNLRTLEILEPLEWDLKKPVVSANQAMMWDALNLAGVRQSLDGFGRLFKTW